VRLDLLPANLSLTSRAAGLLLLLAFGGCKDPPRVECEFDIDCRQACQVCDPGAGRCIPDSRCLDLVEGHCERDLDCDPLLERCLAGACVPAFDGGLPDGGDGDPGTCPDLSGNWDLATDCAGLGAASGVPISQLDCDLAFALGTQLCTARLSGAGVMSLQCAGHDFTCSGAVTANAPFGATCTGGCQFGFAPVDPRRACSRHDQPACADQDQVCDLTCHPDGWHAACSIPNPSGRAVGHYCSALDEVFCQNSMCFDGACLAFCLIDADCAGFAGTVCRDVPLAKGACAADTFRVCQPELVGQTPCGHDIDCKVGDRCSFAQLDDRVLPVCATPAPDRLPPGAACQRPEQCRTRVCLCDQSLCDEQAGVCSMLCIDDRDCPQGTVCDSIQVPDLLGRQHPLSACVRDPASCGRDADCQPGRSCQALLDLDAQAFVSSCRQGGGTGAANTGDACVDDSDCFSLACRDNPPYCAALCLSDLDCPVFDSGVACTQDADCPADHRCEANSCLRSLECWTFPFFWQDPMGIERVDLVNQCLPNRSPCGSNLDCPAGQICRGYPDKDATDVYFGCALANPGGGALGVDCQLTGSPGCATNICVFDNEAGMGHELWYCSQICQVDADCDDPAQYHCQQVHTTIRPGYEAWTGICLVTQDL
jgi:hypothetical protein